MGSIRDFRSGNEARNGVFYDVAFIVLARAETGVPGGISNPFYS